MKIIRVSGYRLEAGSSIRAFRDILESTCDGIDVRTTRPWFFTEKDIVFHQTGFFGYSDIQWTISIPDTEFPLITVCKKDCVDALWDIWEGPLPKRPEPELPSDINGIMTRMQRSLLVPRSYMIPPI